MLGSNVRGRRFGKPFHVPQHEIVRLRPASENAEAPLTHGEQAYNLLRAFNRPVAVDEFARQDLEQLLEEARRPVLVIGSPDDALVSRSALDRVARYYQGSPLLFPGMGHVMMLDGGWQEPLDAVLDWLVKAQAAVK